ncbi:MAG: TSUP family transporter, partial [Chloroflexota bacterium]
MFLIGIMGGFASGLLGIGGGIVMVPLLAYVGGLSFHMATAISVLQVFVAGASGVLRHYRLHSVDLPAALMIGGASAVTAATSSILSPQVPALWLQTGFTLLLLTSMVMLMVPH